MKPVRESGDGNGQQPVALDLMYGFSPWHVRVLCDDPWEGGRGMDADKVGDLTLDQVFMMFADRRTLRRGTTRAAAMAAPEVGAMADEDGLIRGRAADGTPIKGRVAGKSYATQVRERLAAVGKMVDTPKTQTDATTCDETQRQRRIRRRAERRQRRETRRGS